MDTTQVFEVLPGRLPLYHGRLGGLVDFKGAWGGYNAGFRSPSRKASIVSWASRGFRTPSEEFGVDTRQVFEVLPGRLPLYSRLPRDWNMDVA